MHELDESVSSNRIAVLLPDLRGGGAETLRVRLAQVLKKRGFPVEFWLANAGGDLLEEASAAHPIIDLQARRIRSLYRPLLQTWIERKPAVVIADMWPNTVVAAACRRKTRRLGVPGQLMICDQNTLSLKPECQGVLRRQALSKSVRLTYPWADSRVTVSAGVADDLANVSGLPRDDFKVIYNAGFGETKEEPMDDPWPDANVKLLCVGSMKEQKGFPLAIEALAKLDRPDAVLAIVGEGSLRGELESLAQRLGVADQVLMPGFSDNVHPWYAHADVFCLSSKWEGFGIVIVEALQYGVQVVSTDCQSGPAEILEDGKHGRLVPVGDSSAFAAAIEQAIMNPIPADQLRARAAEFDIERIADQYLQLLFPELRVAATSL